MNIDLAPFERLAMVSTNAKLSEYTTFKIGGKAKLIAAPQDADALAGLIAECKKQDVPYFILGAGSNLLVADEGVDAVVIYTGAMSSIKIEGNIITAQAGATLSTVKRHARDLRAWNSHLVSRARSAAVYL